MSFILFGFILLSFSTFFFYVKCLAYMVLVPQVQIPLEWNGEDLVMVIHVHTTPEGWDEKEWRKDKKNMVTLLSLTCGIPLSHSSDQKERPSLGAFCALNQLWAAVESRPGAVGKEKNGKFMTILSLKFLPPSPVSLLANNHFLDFSESCTVCSYMADHCIWWERPSQVCLFHLV